MLFNPGSLRIFSVPRIWAEIDSLSLCFPCFWGFLLHFQLLCHLWTLHFLMTIFMLLEHSMVGEYTQMRKARNLQIWLHVALSWAYLSLVSSCRNVGSLCWDLCLTHGITGVPGFSLYIFSYLLGLNFWSQVSLAKQAVNFSFHSFSQLIIMEVGPLGQQVTDSQFLPLWLQVFQTKFPLEVYQQLNAFLCFINNSFKNFV